jgi:glycosyltransferase involved in cell wall biosynthesis
MSSKLGTNTVALVAYHFYPSPEVGAKRMTALATSLRAAGQRVVVVSAFEGLEEMSSDDKRLGGYLVRHIPYQPSAALGLMVRIRSALRDLLRAHRRTGEAAVAAPGGGAQERQRSIAYRSIFNVLHVIDDKKSWSRRAARRIMGDASDESVGAIVASGPPMSCVAAAVFAGRRRGIPVVADLRDPICGEPGADFSVPGVPVQWGRRTLERYVVSRAAAVTTTSPTLRDRLRQRYPAQAERIECVYNGFDESPRVTRGATGNQLVIVYAGALYLNRDPFPFLEEMDEFLQREHVDDSKIKLVFAGECDTYRGISLNSWLSGRRVGRIVSIRPRLGPAELAELYEAATLLLNFAEGQKMQVPAKTFELLALGREVLMLCESDSDTAAVVRGIEGVSCISTASRPSIRACLEDLYRRHVIEGTLHAPSRDAIAAFSRTSQNRKFLDAIEVVRLKTGDTGSGTRG